MSITLASCSQRPLCIFSVTMWMDKIIKSNFFHLSISHRANTFPPCSQQIMSSSLMRPSRSEAAATTSTNSEKVGSWRLREMARRVVMNLPTTSKRRGTKLDNNARKKNSSCYSVLPDSTLHPRAIQGKEGIRFCSAA